MADLKVDLSQITAHVSKRFKKITQEVEKRVVESINEATIDFAYRFAEAVRTKVILPKVPVSSGALKDAITVDVFVKKSPRLTLIFSLGVGDSPEVSSYAYVQEFGSSAHDIAPKSKKSLKFIGKPALKRQPKYSKKVHYNLRTKAVQTVYSTKVHVRGVKGKYFMRAGMKYIMTHFAKLLKTQELPKMVQLGKVYAAAKRTYSRALRPTRSSKKFTPKSRSYTPSRKEVD